MNRDDWPGHGSKYDRVPGQPGETFLHDFTVAESQNDVRSLIEERLTWSVRAVLLGGGSPRATSYQMCAWHDAQAAVSGQAWDKVRRYRTEGRRQQGKGIPRNGVSGGSMRQNPCT